MSGKIMGKFLNFIGLEEDIIDEPVDELSDRKSSYQEELIEPKFQTKNKKGRVVNIHSTAYTKVVVYQALTYDDTQNIIDNLKSRKPIIVNLDCIEQDLAQRVLDFLSGAVYALDGTIQKVSRCIFVLAPNNVDIIGNIPDKLKGKGFYNLNSTSKDD